MSTSEPAFDELADDEDELDACHLDFTEDPVSDDDIYLVALAPDGDETKLEAYRELFHVATS